MAVCRSRPLNRDKVLQAMDRPIQQDGPLRQDRLDRRFRWKSGDDAVHSLRRRQRLPDAGASCIRDEGGPGRRQRFIEQAGKFVRQVGRLLCGSSGQGGSPAGRQEAVPEREVAQNLGRSSLPRRSAAAGPSPADARQWRSGAAGWRRCARRTSGRSPSGRASEWRRGGPCALAIRRWRAGSSPVPLGLAPGPSWSSPVVCREPRVRLTAVVSSRSGLGKWRRRPRRGLRQCYRGLRRVAVPANPR